MSLTLSNLRDRYWLKVGESSGNSLDTTTQVDDRLNEAYQYIQRVTGCTWKKGELVSLSAVTLTTNYHDLSTLLTLTSGASVHSIHQVLWDGTPLAEWNKARVDQMNEYDDSHSGSDPVAFAFFTEGAGSARKDYISFYPYIAESNTTDCLISYFEKLPDLSATTDYPRFDPQWHSLIADVAADARLLDTGDGRASLIRFARTEDRLGDMKMFYYDMLNIGDLQPSFASRRSGWSKRFYGE